MENCKDNKTMIKALIFIALLFTPVGSSAQNVIRKGNTFKLQTKSSRTKGDTLVTPFRFEDSKGQTYPIVVNRQSRCYIWRKSFKTGKVYKSYMTPKISQAVCQELHITYKNNK